MVIECAFGRLKGRWRFLLKRNDTDIHKLPVMLLHAAFFTIFAKTIMMKYMPSG